MAVAAGLFLFAVLVVGMAGLLARESYLCWMEVQQCKEEISKCQGLLRDIRREREQRESNVHPMVRSVKR